MPSDTETAASLNFVRGAIIFRRLKTPMTSILGYADTLLTVRLQRQQQERALSYISSECRRLSRLSVKMLELTGLYETGEARFAPTENSVKSFLEDSRQIFFSFRRQRLSCLESSRKAFTEFSVKSGKQFY